MQTQDYTLQSGRGVAGQIADTTDRTVDSFAAEGVVGFGKAVERGTDAGKQVKAFAGGTLVGIALFSQTEVTGQYENKGAVAVMTRGRVIVDTLAVSVTAGEAAYVTDAGVFTNVVGTNTQCGTFLTSGNGLQVLQVNG